MVTSLDVIRGSAGAGGVEGAGWKDIETCKFCLSFISFMICSYFVRVCLC